MPNTKTVRALINAFNVHNYNRNTVETNFTLQSRGKKDYIVVSFEKSMDTYQCRRYLDSIKRKIIREFYGIEESNDAEILDTAKLIFDVNSFPFDISDRDWSWDEQHGFKFVTPVDKGVIFNLKSHLAASLAKDVIEGMPTCNIRASDRKGYLWYGEFDNKRLRQQFEREFLSRMRERYENAPKNPLKVEGNSVYIRDVFDDARFIDSVVRYKTWLEGMYLGVDSSTNHRVKLFKDMIIESISQSTGVTIYGFVCASPLDRKEASVLVPVILDDKGARLLTHEEALKLNYAFNNVVLGDLNSKTQAKLSVNGSNVVYGIDFSNPEISHCVITKIIESSVINKDHELAIDPERALSPVQSPFNSPMHAGPSGLRTPPNRRKTDTDSGYDSNSPPKPKDSGARSSSGGPGPSTQLSEMEWESPTRSQDGVLKESPGQGLVSVPQLDPLDVAGTSGGPLTRLSSTAVSGGVRETSSSVQSVGTVQNVQAGTSAWSQPINPWSSSASSAGLWSLPQIRPSSSKGANEGVQTGKSIWYASSSHSPDVEDVKSIFSVEPEKQQVSGECSEAKSKESESPKKHKGGFLCKERWLPLTNFSSFKRHSVERDTMYSSKSDLVYHVTKKPPVSKPFFSFPTRIKAKSNPPSEVTSPTHEGGPEWQQRLNPDQREKLRPLLSPELQKKLDSNSLSPEDEQLKHLLYTPSGQEKMKKNFESQEENLRRSVNAQLPANPSSKKVDRGSGFCSMGSPAVPHKGSVSSKVKECDLQQAKYMSKALEKN
ncbi:hypothetical protein [Wolbachia endosymbiont (group A) of Gastracanthus pulcherrimus]|uniref:hypothetical protein n=1 Tax=Wolbachia endosymbiont (group A) of Gastracanthus pulcherrimus TaxID=3066200 RepID=UPI00333EF664